MSRAVLELNDIGLLMQFEGGDVVCEPGFAQLTAAGIVCGEEARAAAWLQPQSSYNQYWRQLNQLALPVKSPVARHFADIAFAQLKQLHQQSGEPETLLLAVPGSFNSTQLSLLLGMLSALPVTVEAVVDSGLAACLQQSENSLLIDLQLHQSVLSLCQCQAGEVQLVAQKVIPDLGLLTLHNTVARHISRRLIEDERYDPLHNSSGEQALYDQLPGWLQQLMNHSEIPLTIASPQGDLPLLLRKNAVAEQLTTRCSDLLSAVHELLASYPGTQLKISHRSSLLAGFIAELKGAEVMAEQSVFSHCFQHSAALIERSEPIHCLKSLPVLAGQGASAVTQAQTTEIRSQISHLLYQHRAWPLRQPLSIRLRGESLQLINGVDQQADLVLQLERQRLTVLQQKPGLPFELPAQLTAGGCVLIGSHQLQLIEVSDG
jgi:hypothetical protein